MKTAIADKGSTEEMATGKKYPFGMTVCYQNLIMAGMRYPDTLYEHGCTV